MEILFRPFYFSVFLCVLTTAYNVKTGKLPCHEVLTSVLRGIEKSDRLITDVAIFDSPNYIRLNATHFRVCICTKLPCLRKCCPPGEIFIAQTCQPHYADIHPEVFNEKLELIPNYGVENFHRVYGNTCTSEIYKLDPEDSDERYYLLYNGTLRVVEGNIGTDCDTSQFCFENILTNLSRRDDLVLEAFMCFPSEPFEAGLLYPIGMIVSIPFLLATFIVYSLPELRNLHGKNLMSEVAALLVAYIILVITQLGNGIISDTACIVLGFILQYAFLATFFWLNVMSFDIWSAFRFIQTFMQLFVVIMSRSPLSLGIFPIFNFRESNRGFGRLSSHLREKERKKFILYSCYAWGVPLLISTVTAALNYAPDLPDFIIRPSMGTDRCFFGNKKAHVAYFYGPAAVVVIADIVFFTLTAFKICKVRKETKMLNQSESRRTDESSKQRYYLYLKLFMVMGISWVMEIISWSVKGPEELWYLTDSMNSLQGLFIFWIFVCTRKIKKILKSRFCSRQSAKDETHTSTLKITTSANSDGAAIGLQNMRKIEQQSLMK